MLSVGSKDKTTPSGEGVEFFCWDVTNIFFQDHRTGLVYLLEEMSYRD